MDFKRFKPKRSAARWLQDAPAHVVAVYDNGGKSADRYTVLYGAPLWTPDYAEAWHRTPRGDPRLLPARAMSNAPFSPQGVGLFVDALRGPHLGKKIPYSDLPDDCKRLVEQDGQDD